MLAHAARFLRPTRNKLIFLIEWLLFLIISVVQGGLRTGQQLMVAAYPFLFFYLAAAAIESLNRKFKQITRGWRMLALALGVVLLDHVIKLLVVTFIPFRTIVPIFRGWLNLAHNCNFQGSWVLSQMDRPVGSLLPLGMMAFLMMICTWFGYRYYLAYQRSSLWAEFAFLGLFAGLASWLVEMPLRGHIVDFLCLPGVVTADLKDIYLTIGIAATFVETLDNPDLSRPWQGWRAEKNNMQQLIRRFLVFSGAEINDAWQKLRVKLEKK
jgi:lipoprotein signal peptidase